jgi:hypothetical protein
LWWNIWIQQKQQQQHNNNNNDCDDTINKPGKMAQGATFLICIRWISEYPDRDSLWVF